MENLVETKRTVFNTYWDYEENQNNWIVRFNIDCYATDKFKALSDLKETDFTNTNDVEYLFNDKYYEYKKTMFKNREKFICEVKASSKFKNDSSKEFHNFTYKFEFDTFEKGFEFFQIRDCVIQDPHNFNFLGIYPLNNPKTLKYKKDKQLVLSY